MDPTMQSQLMASALMRPQQNLYPSQQNQMQQPQQSMQGMGQQGMGQQAGGLNMGALMGGAAMQQPNAMSPIPGVQPMGSNPHGQISVDPQTGRPIVSGM